MSIDQKNALVLQAIGEVREELAVAYAAQLRGEMTSVEVLEVFTRLNNLFSCLIVPKPVTLRKVA